MNPDDPDAPAINEHSIFEMSKFLLWDHYYVSDIWHRPYSGGKMNELPVYIPSYEMTSDVQ